MWKKEHKRQKREKKSDGSSSKRKKVVESAFVCMWVYIGLERFVCYPMYSWIAHLIVTFMWNPIAFQTEKREWKNEKHILYSRKRRNLLCFGCWMWLQTYDRSRKKTCHRKQMRMKKKLKNRLEIYGMPMLLKSRLFIEFVQPRANTSIN